jgi:hypothetical protein
LAQADLGALEINLDDGSSESEEKAVIAAQESSDDAESLADSVGAFGGDVQVRETVLIYWTEPPDSAFEDAVNGCLSDQGIE